MKQLLAKLLLNRRMRRAYENCRTLENVLRTLISGFGSTQEASNSLGHVQTLLLHPDATSPETEATQRELMTDYPNVAVALRAWYDLQIAEFQTRRFPVQMVVDHLSGLQIVLRRTLPNSDEDVLRNFYRLEQTKTAILATALTGGEHTPPLQGLADLTLSLQLARLASTTPSARPDWLPESWRTRDRDSLVSVAKDFWKEATFAIAAAPNWPVRLKLYFLITSRWSFEMFIRGRRVSTFKKIDLAFDETVKLALELARDPIRPAPYPEMNMIVRHQLARVSRCLPDVRLAITNMKLNARNLDKPSMSHLAPMGENISDIAPNELETTSN